MRYETPTWPFDRTQLTLIYRRYIVMVRRRARSVLNDSALAEEAAQETFARFIAYAEHTQVHHVAALLYQSATRVCLERLRAQTRPGLRGKDAEASDRGVWALQHQLQLTQVLAHTDLETAQIATLYYLDGMSQDEVGQVMEVPRRTVSTQLQRFCARALGMLGANEGNAETQERHANEVGQS